jgi:hypothetical protein
MTLWESIDAMNPNEVWILEKGDDGFLTISRASDDATVVAFVKEGLELGSLWYSVFFDEGL